jgi:hypothetical protein
MTTKNVRLPLAVRAAPDDAIRKAVTEMGIDLDERIDGILCRTLFIASTDDVDRMDDIVDQSNWVMEAWNDNPVIPFGHDYNKYPPGRGEFGGLVQGKLAIVARWDMLREDGKTVARLYEEGFLNTVSVGFRPGRMILRSQLQKDDPRYKENSMGRVYYDNELLEVSAVVVPANRRALAQREVEEIVAKGLDPRGLEMEPEARKSLEAADLAEAIAPVLREMLAEQVEQLRGVVRESVLAGLRESSADIVAEGLAKAFERQAPATVLKGPDADWWDANVTASENTGASDSDWNTW